MIELIQIPWSPYCLVQRRILEYAGVAFKIVNVGVNDRTLVWKVTKQRYYQVPVIKDGRNDVFEVSEESQVIAKYLDDKLRLGLFPRELEGVQSILWRYIESEIEGLTFKLNDVYWCEFVPKRDAVGFIRHKERKFGRGCLDQWRERQAQLLAAFEDRLVSFEEMLMSHPFLIDERPRFVDFDLFGMLANFLFSGHYKLPAAHARLAAWHSRMARLKAPKV